MGARFFDRVFSHTERKIGSTPEEANRCALFC